MSWAKYKKKYRPLFRRPKEASWTKKTLEELSYVKIKDLRLSISQSSLLSQAIKEVLREWERLGFSWQPSFWLSTEWYYAEGTKGVAIPFYLAHPHLMALEKYLIGRIEGKDKEDIKKYLRHELGHLLDYAYRWRFHKSRRQLFGLSSQKYPISYTVVSHSKKYVRNLPAHYAQSHPDEDFAETFAYYMKYRTVWRKKHKSGTLFKKLSLIEELVKMAPVSQPKNLSGFRPGKVNQINLSLNAFYLRRAYDCDITYREIEQKFYGMTIKDPFLSLRKDLKKWIEPLAIPIHYKDYLLHRYHSPLFKNKRVLSLWRKGDKRALKKYVQNEPLKWLKNGPFYYT